MSEDREEAMSDRLSRLLAGDDTLEPLSDDDDMQDDSDFEYYLDAEDIDDAMGEDDGDDDDELYDDEDDDEDGPDVVFTGDIDEDEDDEGEDGDEDDDEDGGDEERIAMSELAALFSNTPGAAARNSLLARLLGGAPASQLPNSLLRRLGVTPVATQTTPEERARLLAERRRKARWWAPQLEPHPAGAELLRSGEFGRVRGWSGPAKGRRATRRCLTKRRDYIHSPSVTQATIPNTHGTIVASYPSIPYVGQYAGEDYGLFYAATQYYTIHLYSTKDVGRLKKHRNRPAPSARAPAPNSRAGAFQEDDEDEDDGMPLGNFGSGRGRSVQEDWSMKKIKTVQGVQGQWTVTDCDSDKKAEKMIYSSITPYVHMLRTGADEEEHVCLDFSSRGARGQYGYGDDGGIWSIRFSADGKEVVAGARHGKIMVYDIEADCRSLSVSGHADDVNAVCFADEASTNILVSGSDDGYVKIWDRRSLSSSTPSGVLAGATEGITYTAPKGDGRYIVVNSKDQAARLYDIRKMRSHSEFAGEADAVVRYGQQRYDYRHTRYPPPTRLAHPKDCSVMTYRGHQVSQTLIRCHFSPRESTGQNYIYSGSADGMIHIWSLDGRVIQVLDRSKTADIQDGTGQYNDPAGPDTPNASTRRPQSTYAYGYGSSNCVRDVSWHGYEPTLMSTCWEIEGRNRNGGTLAKHEWKGLGKGGMRNLEDWVEKTKAELAETA